jgi:hypothetical protein
VWIQDLDRRPSQAAMAAGVGARQW